MGLLAGLLLTGAAWAAEPKVSGQVFGDYYWVLAADPHSAATERQNAVQIRRLYLTVDRDLSDAAAVRVRLEANDPGFANGRDPDRDRMNAYVKNAYLLWRKALGPADVVVGMAGTPTWALSEEYWGYRSLEKTVMDLQKVGTPVDLGVGFKGALAAPGLIGQVAYFAMVSQGTGLRAEDDHGKKLALSLSTLTPGKVRLEGYVDTNRRPHGHDQTTWKGFVGAGSKAWRGGVEAFTRRNGNDGTGADAGRDVTLEGVSAFASLPLTASMRGFGRFDAVHNGGADRTDMLVIVGADRQLGPGCHLMPNLYANLPEGLDPNLQARLTLDVVF
jgi:hypothetical protein